MENETKRAKITGTSRKNGRINSLHFSKTFADLWKPLWNMPMWITDELRPLVFAFDGWSRNLISASPLSTQLETAINFTSWKFLPVHRRLFDWLFFLFYFKEILVSKDEYFNIRHSLKSIKEERQIKWTKKVNA